MTTQLPSPEEEIIRLLNFVTRTEASDLPLKVGYAPYVRLGGAFADGRLAAVAQF